MKTFIGVFWQETLIKLSITTEELLILDWFRLASKKLPKKTLENEEYTIISYNKIIDDLPILTINGTTNERQIKYRIDKLVEKKVLKKFKTNTGKNEIYIKFDEEWSNLYPGDKEVKEDVCKIDNSDVHSTYGNNNNTRNSSNNKQSDDYKRDFEVYESQIKEIIKYFNDYCSLLNTTYRHDIEFIYKPIIDNLRKGYKPKDFRNVIRKKYCEWYTNLKMRPYLRPQTLFGDKFELYLTGAEPNGYPWHGKTDEEIEKERTELKNHKSEFIELC